MSTISREWNISFEIVRDQIEAFNRNIQSSNKLEEINQVYEPKELDRIYQITKKQVSHLKKLSEEIENRQKALSKGSAPHQVSVIKKTAALNVTSKVFSIGGALLAILSTGPVFRWLGLGVLTLAEAFDSATTIYSNKIFFDEDEKSTLAAINKEGIEQARVFKKFIKRLKEIREIEKSKLHELQVHLSIDSQIGNCLKEYEALGCYSKDEVYFRILSLLIQHLPEEDPLKMGFKTLQPSRVTDFTPLAQQPLPIQYLPAEKKEEESLKSPNSSNNKWLSEKDSHLLEENDSLQTKEEYVKSLAYYKLVAAQRFNLSREVKHFHTLDGWCITSTGIKPTTKIEDPLDSEHQEPKTEKVDHQQDRLRPNDSPV